MELKRVRREEFAEIWLRMCAAFDRTERRDEAAARALADEPRYALYFLVEEGRRVGFVSVWELEGFAFVEHFAVDETLRAWLRRQRDRMRARALSARRARNRIARERIAAEAVFVLRFARVAPLRCGICAAAVSRRRRRSPYVALVLCTRCRRVEHCCDVAQRSLRVLEQAFAFLHAIGYNEKENDFGRCLCEK